MSEQEIERMLQAKGKTFPRLKPQDLDDVVLEKQFYRFPGTTVTICCLTTKNGYAVIGESAAVSMENFDEEIGKEVAFKEARDKLWPLLGYALREKLYEAARQVEASSPALRGGFGAGVAESSPPRSGGFGS